MQTLIKNTINAIEMREEFSRRLNAVVLEAARKPVQENVRSEEKPFRWNVRRSLLSVLTAAAMLFCAIFIPLTVLNNGDNGTVLEWGFEYENGSSNNEAAPSPPHFEINCAYRFTQTEFKLDEVEVQFFYGHMFTDAHELKNAESDTVVLLIPYRNEERIELKKVDNFLADPYYSSRTVTREPTDGEPARYTVSFEHSETVKIPAERLYGEYGYFFLYVRSTVTDEGVPMYQDGDAVVGSRGWAFSGTNRIYYYIRDGKVKLDTDYTRLLPKSYWMEI